MKKASLLPAVIVGSMGIAFVLASIFPNTTEFPEHPGGPGTISGALSTFFNPDGTAKNAATLSGLTASGYLQDNDCANLVNKVWVGVDENGKGKCGSTTSNLLGYITDYSGSTVQVRHTWDPTNPITITDVGFPIYDGDAVETVGNSLVTIILKDNSAIRLNTGSLVDFTYVLSGSENIAQLILDHGEIWGRVMTSTGMNFGNSDWIAGVRGTAITMDYRNIGTESAPIWTGSINIIDSTAPVGTAAAVVESKYDSNIKTELEVGGKLAIVEAESLVGFSQVGGEKAFANITSAIAEIEDSNVKTQSIIKTTSLVNPWILENTKKDLVYLANLTNSGTLSVGVKDKAKDEFLASYPKNLLECNKTFLGKVPKNNKADKQELRSKRAKKVSVETTLDDSLCGDILNIGNSVKEKINKTACGLGGLKYFGEVEEGEYCEKKGVVAVAEYSQSGTLSGSIGMFTPSGVNLLNLQGTLNYSGKYVPSLDLASRLILDASGATNTGIHSPGMKIGKLTSEGKYFGSGGSGHAIFSIPAQDNFQGLYLDNWGADTFVRYSLPNNINKIEITVRGASLIRGSLTKSYYLFGIKNGYELSISGSLVILEGFSGKDLTVNIPSEVWSNKDKFYTIVFQKDASDDKGTLSILDENGNIPSGFSADHDNVGTIHPYLKGDEPYIYIGTDAYKNNAINDIIDSVRLYNE